MVIEVVVKQNKCLVPLSATVVRIAVSCARLLAFHVLRTTIRSIYKLHVDTIFTMNCCESTQKTNLKINNAAGLEEYSFGTISNFTVFNEANDLL
jgi:hypothetical protein